MPPLLVGACRLLVPALVVTDHRTHVLHRRHPAAAAEQGRTPRVQRPAHLFQGHLRVFPPAAAPYAVPRTPARSTPGSGAGAALDTAGPRNASGPLPACP